MRQFLFSAGLCVALMLPMLPLCAADTAVPPVSTVEAQYLGLSSGPLRQAKLVSLPKGVVLRAGTMTITEKHVAEEIAKAKPAVQAPLKTQQFFLLEQMSLKALLVAEARAWATAEKRDAKESDDAVIRAYLQSVAKTAKVTEEELKAFYAANKAMLGGAAYDTVANDIRSYLLEEKQQEVVDAHINSVGTRASVEVARDWVARHAVTMLDNPVDKARRSGKPSVIDFGRGGCGPCDMMTPILDELHKTYEEQCNVLFCHVGDEPILAARYKIQSIPVQVFFDKDGNEVFRHTGYYPQEKMLEQLAALGVK